MELERKFTPFDVFREHRLYVEFDEVARYFQMYNITRSMMDQLIQCCMAIRMVRPAAPLPPGTYHPCESGRP